MHGLGHSLHIPCNVGSWSDWYPFCWAFCCWLFLAAICCSILVGDDLVTLMVCGCGAAIGAPSCPFFAPLCNIAIPLNFCCRLPPSHSLCRGQWKRILMAAVVSTAATAQFWDLSCWLSYCFLALLPPGDCAVRLLLPDKSSCWWSTWHHVPDCTGILPWSCAMLQPASCRVLSVRLVLCVGVCRDLGHNNVDCWTGCLCFRDLLSLDVNLLDGNVGLVICESVRRFAAETDHSIVRLF